MLADVGQREPDTPGADVVLFNGRVATLDARRPAASAVAIRDGRFAAVGDEQEALRRLREQAQRTPPPQWVRVVGGWSEFQFAERRMPILEELNEAAPDTPVFVLHLYDRALLNGAALRAVGCTRNTPDPPGAEIERDRNGNPMRRARRVRSPRANWPTAPPCRRTTSRSPRRRSRGSRRCSR